MSDLSPSELSPRPLGEVLIHRGQLRKLQLDFILDLQRAYKAIARPYRLGDLLIKHRAISEVALKEALLVQSELPREGITAILARYQEEVSFQTKLIDSPQS